MLHRDIKKHKHHINKLSQKKPKEKAIPQSLKNVNPTIQEQIKQALNNGATHINLNTGEVRLKKPQRHKVN
jgi:hypothetical protein